MNSSKFWPWDYDPEGEIYENVAWDLPGFRLHPPLKRKGARRSRVKAPRGPRVSSAE